jgi:hypothetical protein
MTQFWLVVVSEKETGVVSERMVVPFAVAEKVMKGYQSDDFYQVSAKFVGMAN